MKDMLVTRKHVIYCIENTVNNMKYIGLSCNFERRKTRHFSELRNNKHINQYLQRAYNKYGEQNFIIYILYEGYCTREEIGNLENYYIKKFNSFECGYNQNEGGFDHNGFVTKFSKEDVFTILSVLEFAKNKGHFLANHFKTSPTTINRMKNKNSHEAYHEEYHSLKKKDRKSIFEDFCNKIGERLDMVGKSCPTLKKLKEEDVMLVLSVFEFDRRKNSLMAKKLNVANATIANIKTTNTYKETIDKYNKMSMEERMSKYHEAIEFFNFNVTSCRNAC